MSVRGAQVGDGRHEMGQERDVESGRLKKREWSEMKMISLETKRGRDVPLPTFPIDAEGPKVGLQLGLVPAAWEAVCFAQLDQLLSGHDGTDGARISNRKNKEKGTKEKGNEKER